MPKQKVKTNRSAAKRFKVTGSGKITRWSGGKSHSNAKKGRKRMRRLGASKIEEGGEARRIKSYIPYK
ncbi:MAG TPA: 50S ribosomal protein L35 [Thermodesulfobacteriota bacterium]|jgi:large subunit ribosomal protein L35|nr:50S ribosomal protein L35 [Thermodesulfobacteriota bacterium]